MQTPIGAAAVVAAHDRWLDDPDWLRQAPPDLSTLWRRIEANHRCNVLLWDEEDKARRTDVGDAIIADGKRRIDRYNQARNDAVEAIDEAILAELPARGGPDARLSSETAGAMIDRLSILALKILHMREQALRADAPPRHRAACGVKLVRLVAQRDDLAGCLDRLIEEAGLGRAYFKVYRQYKMYNDPALNPYLGRRGGASSA
ncbi:MAG TPA: DUF4254 domain-containing protein [Rhodocyclaceae bacterium]